MPRVSISAHGLIAVSAIAILLWLALLSPLKAHINRQPIIPPMQAIGIEHTEPFTLHFTASTLSGGFVAEFTHDSPTPLTLAIPDDWQRQEVQGFALADLVSTDSTLGSKRYTLPQGKVQFYVYHPVETLDLYAPHNAPFTVRLTQVNVPHNISSFDVILVQDTPITLW